MVCDPDYAEAILWSEQKHHRFGRRVVGLTDLIGCPRQAAMKGSRDHALDPLTVGALMMGTAWHYLLEDATLGKDSAFHTECIVMGLIDGVPVEGQIDRLYKDRGLISDWKTKSDFSFGKAGEEPEVRDDHLAQLVIGAELCEQTLGWKPTRGLIREQFFVKGQRSVAVDPLPSLDSVLNATVLSGQATLRDKLHWLDRWVKGEVKWEDMPLHGESEKFGAKTRCDYCVMRNTCWTQAKGAGF